MYVGIQVEHVLTEVAQNVNTSTLCGKHVRLKVRCMQQQVVDVEEQVILEQHKFYIN